MNLSDLREWCRLGEMEYADSPADVTNWRGILAALAVAEAGAAWLAAPDAWTAGERMRETVVAIQAFAALVRAPREEARPRKP